VTVRRATRADVASLRQLIPNADHDLKSKVILRSDQHIGYELGVM